MRGGGKRMPEWSPWPVKVRLPVMLLYFEVEWYLHPAAWLASCYAYKAYEPCCSPDLT